MRRDTLSYVAIVGALMACSDDVPSETATDVVIRPTGLSEVAFTTTSFGMPEGWDGAAPWYVAVHADGRVLAGGSAGLYALGEAIELVDATPVHGILADAKLGFIVATDAGLRVYDGMLYASALETLEARGMARRGPEIWLSTAEELYELEAGVLSAYPDLRDVAAVRTHDASGVLAIEDGAGAITLLRDADGGLEMQALGDELADIAMASPGPDDRVFAVAGADMHLVERVATESGVAWRPVALSADAADDGAAGVDQLAADPVGGALWLAAGKSLRRIDGGGAVSEIAWPAELGTGADELVATADGAVWMGRERELFRVGPDAPPPSYAQHVVPFYEENCARCHEPGGEAATHTRFGSYEEFAALIDTIVEQVEAGNMPSGDYELVGEADLPRKWREGGMRP